MATKKPVPPAAPAPVPEIAPVLAVPSPAPVARRYQVGSTPVLRNGVLYPPGSPIDMPEHQAARLQLKPIDTLGVNPDAN